MVDAIANQPSPDTSRPRRFESFKIADPQYILSVDPAATIEEMTNSLWQDIGGHEILSVVRRDLVDGSNRDFGLVSDLKKLFAEYSPQTIISIENSSSLYFNQFGIKFEKYLPSEQSLLGIDPSLNSAVSIDSDNNITIYVSDVKDYYDVEVQSITSEQILRGTIYEGNA